MFTTIGRKITDCCNHEHVTRDEAQKCLLQHQNEMRKQGKVSNRSIIEFETWEEVEEEYTVY